MKKNTWVKSETMFKINPLTGVSYFYSFKKDYLHQFLSKFLQLKNYPPQEAFFVFYQGNGDLCYKKESSEKLAEKFLTNVLNRPDFGQKANLEIRRRSDNLFKVAHEVLKIDLSKLSDFSLIKLFQKFYQAVCLMHVSGWFSNFVDHEGQGKKALLEYLQKKTGSSDLAYLNKVFFDLTVSSSFSNFEKQEIELLKLVQEVYENQKLKSLFKNYPAKEIFQRLTKENQTFLKKVKEHTEKYGWLTYQFEGPGWQEKDFLEMIKEKIQTGVPPKKLLKEIKLKKQKIVKNRERLFKKFKIDRKHRLLFKFFEDLVFLKGYRKDSLFFGCYTRDKILKEISRRTKIPIKFLRYLYPWEFNLSLFSKKSIVKILKERYRYHLCYYRETKNIKILTGSEAKSFIKELSWEAVKKEETREIYGDVASPGKAKGKVCIVNEVKDISKINKGDILVSEATNPNLMPAIKKAAAIVTDMGGLTCHAAIVSRELGIPCVIGTKVATKVLKDGDLVEVDANKGIVRILK